MNGKKKIQLAGTDTCTGCGACVQSCAKGAISMVEDREGFLQPHIDEKLCVECHKCENNCHVLNPIQKNPQGKVYASWIKDSVIRKNSSSGGLFSALATYVLHKGGVVIGAELQEDNYVRHKIVTTDDALKSLQGSKYVQSIIDNSIYKEIAHLLSSGKIVLFSGTPCQVATIKKLFGKFANQLYTIDLVCHGVPSPKLFAQLLTDIKHDIPNLVSYHFRDTENWFVCTNVNVNVNGKIINKRLYGNKTFYQDAFLKGYMHRRSCYNCVYCTRNRVGDITLADFWGIGQSIHFDGDVSQGCSMVSINTAAGKLLYENIKDKLFSEERNIEETIKGGNAQLDHPVEFPRERDTFYADAYRMSYKRLVLKYHLTINQDSNKLLTIVLRILVKIKHLIHI